MPKLKSKVEGRGNGVKTNIINMVEIAKALARPASYTTKYFGCELGAQTKYDDASGLSIVNGAHDSHTLAGVLEGFIKKFVQCYSCGNPETLIEIDKRDYITLTCKACGFVSKVDPRHKLNTFILKNPPKTNKKKKVEDKMRRADKEREEIGEALDVEMAKKEKAKKKKEKKEKKEKKAKAENGASPQKGADDASASDVADQLSAVKLSPEEEALAHLKEMLSEKKSSKDIAKHLLKNTEEVKGLNLKMQIFVEAVLSTCPGALAEYTQKRSKYFVAVAKEEDQQAALLCGFEHFFTAHTQYLKEAPLVLKVLYDCDAAEEDVILKWHKESTADAVKKQAEPFVTWLETAEEDSDEDSD
eukprot:CAMPEP_0198239150 /NCGR_PEP_ID=MMETSP1446-20131203/4651_1 /TAXON_ID=1461542 ORGANISM="Unidentified sp, Strain CCMP2111" /NCGR_SAMPLE_ID=MMETSP1446 /ASSEMBLY_ACC=CAM_ASM_001112 /LENGTH=358 /DNA_ID=CAMNT_0043921701 /DNA_START=505 /DNA_END=1581 /DNA_ORIENTATION=-